MKECTKNLEGQALLYAMELAVENPNQNIVRVYLNEKGRLDSLVDTKAEDYHERIKENTLRAVCYMQDYVHSLGLKVEGFKYE